MYWCSASGPMACGTLLLVCSVCQSLTHLDPVQLIHGEFSKTKNHPNCLQPFFLLGIVETLHGTTQQVEGLALDYFGNNIYWVDAGAKRIEMSKSNGRFRKVLFNTGLDRPRAIAVDPKSG